MVAGVTGSRPAAFGSRPRGPRKARWKVTLPIRSRLSPRRVQRRILARGRFLFEFRDILLVILHHFGDIKGRSEGEFVYK